MSTLAVQKVRGPESSATPLFEEMRKMFGEVERKAFDLFQSRGCSLGHDLDDWLQAERETLSAPPAELAESAKAYAIRMAIPGYLAKEVQITATPHEVIVKAEHAAAEGKEGEELRWSELPHNGKLCRAVPLPQPVDVDKVTATLHEGMLVIKAAKAETQGSREIAIAKANSA